MSDLSAGRSIKGLVLAAGLGNRLRPLTAVLPKPLATVCGVALIDSAIEKMLGAGADTLAVNFHHLPNVLTDHLTRVSSRLFNMNFKLSDESRAILGTGGALIPLREWWGDSLLVVYNGDILSGMDLSSLVVSHKVEKPLVTMALRPEPPSDGGRSVWVDELGFVRIICRKQDLPSTYQGLSEFSYACAYVSEPGLMTYFPDKAGEFDLIEGFNKALENNEKITSVKFDCFWADIGTPRSLWQTNLDVAAMSAGDRQKLLGSAYTAESCQIIGHNVLTPDVTGTDGKRLSGCVLLGDAEIRPDEKLTNHLRGYGFDVSF